MNGRRTSDSDDDQVLWRDWEHLHATYTPRLANGWIAIDARSVDDIHFKSWPPHPIVLRNVGMRNKRVKLFCPIEARRGLPRQIRIGIGAELSEFQFQTKGQMDHIEFLGELAEGAAFAAYGVVARRLDLTSVVVALEHDATVETLNMNDRVTLAASRTVTVEHARVGPACAIETALNAQATLFVQSPTSLAGNPHFGSIRCRDLEELTMPGSFSMDGAPSGLSISATGDVTIAKDPAAPAKPVLDIILIASGDVYVDGGSLYRCVVSSGAALRLLNGARVVGTVCSAEQLLIDSGSSLVMDDWGLSRFGRIETVRGEIDGLSPYVLSHEDITALERAIRFVPVVAPRSRFAIRRRQSRADKDRIASEFVPTQLMQQKAAREEDRLLPHSDWQSRAAFWSRLKHLVETKHSPGHIQSEVRYAWMRARLKASSPWSRERLLLRLYRTVGYGERIGRPMLVHSTICLLVALGLRSPQRDYWQDTAKVFASPLRFFGADIDILTFGFLEGSLVIAAQTVGIILMVFALIAVRRVTKAE